MKQSILLCAALLLFGCTDDSGPSVTLLDNDGNLVTIAVEVARTPEEQQKGLMGRTSLDDDQGMLFIFETQRPLSFWMKNTLIPLDILFFDAQGAFVSSATMTPCTADPCKNYPSAGLARYALEVPAGFMERKNIAPATTLQIHDAAGRPEGLEEAKK